MEQMKATVLVVEDHPSMLSNIAFTLEMAGYAVLKASNGKEALELLKSHTPDLILSDIMMPEMDGYALIDEVHANPDWRAIPFIFLTARSEQEDVRLGRRLGSDDYLVKPLDPDDLLSAVEGKLKRMGQLRDAYVGEKEELEAQMVETERLAMVGTIATSTIHEMRNPLTAVRGFAELLQLDLPPDSPAHENLDIIIEQVSHVNRIAQQVLDMAHPVLEDFQVAMPTEIVDRTLQLFGKRFDKLNVTLEKEYPPQPVFINARPDQIQQVFLNLLLNALQSMPGGGTLSLRVREVPGEMKDGDGRAVEIEVVDEGEGIAEEDMQHIFEPFFTTKPKGEGTGLGLYVCRIIIRQHGGTITASSTRGKGTSITVRLPTLLLDDA